MGNKTAVPQDNPDSGTNNGKFVYKSMETRSQEEIAKSVFPVATENDIRVGTPCDGLSIFQDRMTHLGH